MVITAPVVGKLSRQSLEQIVGTLVGGILGYLTWLIIDAYHISKDGFLLSLCLSLCSAAMGFFNVVIEESLADANMTALTFLSVVFGTTESPTGIFQRQQQHPSCSHIGGFTTPSFMYVYMYVCMYVCTRVYPGVEHVMEQVMQPVCVLWSSTLLRHQCISAVQVPVRLVAVMQSCYCQP